jgi:hypothetical protein
LRRSCRLAALARIGEGAGAASAAGWPDRIRCTLLQRREGRVATCGGGFFGVSSTSSTSLRLSSASKTAVARQPTSSDRWAGKSETLFSTPNCGIASPQSWRNKGGRTSGGCLATVEVGPWTKLKCSGRRRRRLGFLFAARGCIESYRASRRRSQRLRPSIFESAMMFGMNDGNERILTCGH